WRGRFTPLPILTVQDRVIGVCQQSEPIRNELMGFCISVVLAAIYCIADMSQFIGMRSLAALLQRQAIWRQLLLVN
ncbi:hypothetical protein, partial [Yersinia similis]